jgi:hypothetical protein
VRGVDEGANTFLSNLALNTDDLKWIRNLSYELKHEVIKKNITISFENYSIEDYRNLKEYLKGQTLIEKLEYLQAYFGSNASAVTGLFIIENILQ